MITLKTGTRGIVWVNGTACIIEEGQHCFMEDNFTFGGSEDISTKHYQLGPFHYVTVDAGEVGVKHNAGHLEVLTAGTHIIRTQVPTPIQQTALSVCRCGSGGRDLQRIY